MKEIAFFIVILGMIVVAAFLGAYFSKRGEQWYQALRHSPLSPPSVVFSIVWTVLYILLAISAFKSLQAVPSEKIHLVFALFAAHLVFNGLWSYLFFELHRPRLAFLDNCAVVGSLVVIMYVVHPYSREAALVLVPYVIWGCFALFLNFETIRRNS